MAINPGYALQFKRTLDRASEPKRARATGTVTAVSSDSDGKIRSATVSTGSGLLSVPVPYGTNVYTGMTVAITNDGTPSNAQWRLSGTTSVPGGIQGGSIINHDGNTFAMFDSIWVRNDGVIIVGGDVDSDGDPTGPRVESNQCGYFGYDQYDRQSLAIYAANCGGYYAGDVFLGPEEMSRISVLPTEGVIRVVNEGRTSLEFSPDGNFIRDPLTIGNPVGARINIGEIEDKATLVVRGKNGVAKLVARTGDNDDVYLHVGNPPPEDNSMWFDSADGRLNVNGHVTMQSMDVRGRATFSSTGSFLIADPDDPGRFGATTPRGQYAYTTNSLGETHLIRVDAWGPLVLEDVLGSGEWRTWVGGSQIFGDPRYRHFRIERGATARAGLFNGETPVAYMDQAGKGYFTGEVTMESGVVNGDVLITDGGVLTFDAISGKFNGGGIRWEKSGTEYLRIGTQVDQGSVVGNIVDSHTVDLSLYSDGSIYIIPGAGQQTIIGGMSYSESGSNYTAFSKTGDITLAGTATFTSPNGIIGPTWKPAADSTTALQLQNAAGTAIVTVDTSNSRVGVGKTPTVPFDLVGSTTSNVASYLNKNDAINWGGIYYGFALADGTSEFGLTFGAYNSGGNKIIRLLASGSPTEWRFDAIANDIISFEQRFMAKAGLMGQYHTDLDIVLNHHTNGGADKGIKFKVNGGSATAMAVMETSKVGIQTTSPDSPLHVHLDDAATNAASQLLTLSHNTSGTVDNGFGSRMLWELESGSSVDQTAAALDVIWTDKTHASRTAKAVWHSVRSGTLYELAAFSGAEGVVLNETGESWADFRVEGDMATHLLFVDASADAVGIGTSAPDARFHVQQTTHDVGVRDIVRITHNSTGTPGKGFGVAIALAAELDGAENIVAGRLAAAWNTVGAEDYTGDLIGYASDAAGDREGWRVRASGSAPMLSFFGATPILRPTTSHAAATFTANSGTAVNDASTFDGYTIKQVVKALRDLGALT